jgi:hypothetical protein
LTVSPQSCHPHCCCCRQCPPSSHLTRPSSSVAYPRLDQSLPQGDNECPPRLAPRHCRLRLDCQVPPMHPTILLDLLRTTYSKVTRTVENAHATVDKDSFHGQFSHLQTRDQIYTNSS